MKRTYPVVGVEKTNTQNIWLFKLQGPDGLIKTEGTLQLVERIPHGNGKRYVEGSLIPEDPLRYEERVLYDFEGVLGQRGYLCFHAEKCGPHLVQEELALEASYEEHIFEELYGEDAQKEAMTA